MKRCSSLGRMKSDNQEFSASVTDGPYLFYNDNGIISIRGEWTNWKFSSEKKNFPNSEIESKLHEVLISQNQSNFTFKICKSHQIPPYKYDTVDRVFCISDVEGDFNYFQKMLLTHGIMDERYNWTYGSGHLVVLGDIFNRDDFVTEVLWLMYKLDQEASSFGGVIHIILGNHESMCLSGDDRYIHKKYRRFAEDIGYKYKELYSNKTVLGAWLRTKNSVEIINKILFVHGGISPVLSSQGMKIKAINDIVRNALDRTKSGNLNSSESLVMGSNGPLWYRGYVKKEIDTKVIKTILDIFNVEQIVIGHTVVDSVCSLYDGSVFAIDIKRKNKDIYESLLIENGQFYKATSQGKIIPL